MKKTSLCLIIAVIGHLAHAQSRGEKFKTEITASEYIAKTDIRDKMLVHDFAPLLTQTPQQRVLGFIGKDYRRIRIKFISVIKNRTVPEQYFVYGKSMVKDNVCDFQGTLTIDHAFHYKESDAAGKKQGVILGTYKFYENPTQKHVGYFDGVFTTDWYIDEDGTIHYDDLASVADGFNNNQFVGTWTSYDGKIIQACHWGDHRIPMSEGFDDGAGDFHPNEKYINNGWLTYVQAYGGQDKTTREKALQMENRTWWK